MSLSISSLARSKTLLGAWRPRGNVMGTSKQETVDDGKGGWFHFGGARAGSRVAGSLDRLPNEDNARSPYAAVSGALESGQGM